MPRSKRQKTLIDGLNNYWITCPYCGHGEFGVADMQTRTADCFTTDFKKHVLSISRVGNSVRVELTFDPEVTKTD